MSTFEFLIELKNQGIDVAMNGDRLKLQAPKGALTPHLKAELSQRKEEIIQFLQRASSVDAQPQHQQVNPVDRNGPLPLSPAQERVWSLFRLNPTGTGLTVPIVWHVDGPVDDERLQNAWAQMVARHEILRTFYPEVDGTPQAVVLPHYAAPFSVINLQNQAEPSEEAQRLIDQEVGERPFDLTTTPPHRVFLYQLDEGAILLLNFHQIVCDWSSFELLVHDLNHLYAHQDGSALPQSELQYVDFANWKQQMRQGATAEKLNTFWRERLEATYPLLQLPVNQTAVEPSISKVHFTIEADLASQLRQLSKRHGTTMFVLMLTAVKALLSAYAPKDEVMVFTSTGQDKVGFDYLLGLFANLIPLRTAVDPTAPFSDLLRQVRQTTLSAVAHQHLPLEDILEHLNWQSNKQSNNLFQVIFIYQQHHAHPLTFGNSSTELLSAGEHLGAFDLRLLIEDDGQQLHGEIEFAPTHLDMSFISQLGEQLEQLLATVVVDEATMLAELVSKKVTAVIPATPAKAAFVSPRNDIEQQLVALWQEALKLKQVGIHDNFFDLGGHSLLAAKLFANIHKATGKNLPLASLIHSPTIAEQAKLIREDAAHEGWRLLVPIQTAGDRPPLFLIHGAGGNILLYQDVARDLGTDQPVYGIQAQGLDGRSDYLTDFKLMAAKYIDEIKSVQPTGPYYLGGYCLGGALAYEMAQQLKARGEETALVAMFETFNIHSNPATYNGTYAFIHKLQNLWFHADNILKLPLTGKIAFFKEKAAVQRERIQQRIALKRKNRQNQAQDEPLIHVLIDQVNDDAHEAYFPEPYNGRVAIFRPIKDFKGMEDPSYGWGELIPEESRLVEYLNVNPKGMIVTPFSQQLAARLRQLMDQSTR